MIERLFSLELKEMDVRLSNVAINQGNRDSVNFRFRIFDMGRELDYQRFNAARATFSHRGRAIAAVDCLINPEGIICTPPPEAFGRHGIINGQLDLGFNPEGNLATNYFSFTVTPSLVRLPESERQFFSDQIAALLGRLTEDLNERKQEFEDALEQGFDRISQLSDALAEAKLFQEEINDLIEEARRALTELGETLGNQDLSGVGTVTTVTVDEGPANVEIQREGTLLNFNFAIPKGIQGRDGAGLQILDEFDTMAQLRAAHPTGSRGDAFLVQQNLVIWSEQSQDWHDAGSLTGGAVTPIKDNLTSSSVYYALSANQGRILNEAKAPRTHAHPELLAPASVVNNLTSTAANAPLSANQGRILNDAKAPRTHTHTDLLSPASVVNNLTSTAANAPLSANQGRILNDAKAPRTHAHPELLAPASVVNNLTSTAANAPLSANMGRVLSESIGSSNNLNWHTLSLLNGLVQDPDQPLRAARKGVFVYMQGLIHGVASQWRNISVLPAEFRPRATMGFVISSSILNAQFAYVTIDFEGTMRFSHAVGHNVSTLNVTIGWGPGHLPWPFTFVYTV